MDTFVTAFSFTFGIVVALACLPFLIVLVTTGIPAIIMTIITRFSSKGWKAKQWKRAVRSRDAGQMRFLRKWGFDRTE